MSESTETMEREKVRSENDIDAIRSSDEGASPVRTLRVSVVINNYNYAHFLPDAVDSSLALTYPHVEVIVVDDGSCDDSRAVIEGYGEQVTGIFKQNGGQASALNAGFERSSGDIVIFLDADDRLRPDAADLVVEQFSHRPDLALVMYRLAVIDTNGTATGTLKPPDYLPRPSGDLRQHLLSFPFDIQRMATSGNAFSAWALREIMPIPERDYPRMDADWYLNYVIPLFGPVAFLDEIGGDYRIHDNNHFERGKLEIDLRIVRQVIVDDERTARHIAHFARDLDLLDGRDEAEIISVSYIANRLISMRLDPENHPVSDDSRSRLLALGLRASARRFDVSWPMRVMFGLWFVAAALGPESLAKWLGIKLIFPASRSRLNAILSKLHRR